MYARMHLQPSVTLIRTTLRAQGQTPPAPCNVAARVVMAAPAYQHGQVPVLLLSSMRTQRSQGELVYCENPALSSSQHMHPV